MKHSLTTYHLIVPAPKGAPFCLGIDAESDYIKQVTYLPLEYDNELCLSPPPPSAQKILAKVKAQFQAYFRNPKSSFDLPLRPAGTLFQQEVWRLIAKIQPGTTLSYGALSRKCGRDNAARAVGQACGANHYPLIIPCHRVVSSCGLGGFAGHAEGFYPKVKAWLLQHEGVLIS